MTYSSGVRFFPVQFASGRRFRRGPSMVRFSSFFFCLLSVPVLDAVCAFVSAALRALGSSSRNPFRIVVYDSLIGSVGWRNPRGRWLYIVSCRHSA